MDNNSIREGKSDENSMPWASAVNGAMTMSSWLIGPLVVGFLLGDYLDKKYLSSGHKYLYIFLGVAFLVTIVGLLTEMIKFIKWLSDEKNASSPSTNVKALDNEQKK